MYVHEQQTLKLINKQTGNKNLKTQNCRRLLYLLY